MKEQNTYRASSDEDPIKSPEVQDIIMSGVIGCIAVEISKRLEIAPIDALCLFYQSDTCRRLHDKATGLYLFSHIYIAEEFLDEYSKSA
ncbi:MAG: hypothetical protein LIP03_12470 [Bacteroidales bacterium]|nr:hypothetical protein [Bacteroidales bacterium]